MTAESVRMARWQFKSGRTRIEATHEYFEEIVVALRSASSYPPPSSFWNGKVGPKKTFSASCCPRDSLTNIWYPVVDLDKSFPVSSF